MNVYKVGELFLIIDCLNDLVYICFNIISYYNIIYLCLFIWIGLDCIVIINGWFLLYYL